METLNKIIKLDNRLNFANIFKNNNGKIAVISTYATYGNVSRYVHFLFFFIPL